MRQEGTGRKIMPKKKKVYCRNCKEGCINAWGYNECWREDKIIDMHITEHTANRETLAERLNKNNNCKFYRSPWYRFWERR